MSNNPVCPACEDAAKVCDMEADRIREDERRAMSRIKNNPRAFERVGQSVELPLMRAAADVAVRRMVAEQCASAVRSACTHNNDAWKDRAAALFLIREFVQLDQLPVIDYQTILDFCAWGRKLLDDEGVKQEEPRE